MKTDSIKSGNPFQDKATRDQAPRWSKNQGKPGQEKIPAGLRPHPLVDAKIQDPPPGSEGTEPITGDGDPEFEDEPAN
jgi:hypothetical protein